MSKERDGQPAGGGQGPGRKVGGVGGGGVASTNEKAGCGETKWRLIEAAKKVRPNELVLSKVLEGRPRPK